MHSCILDNDDEDLLPGVQALLSLIICASLVSAKAPKVVPVYKSNNPFVQHITKPLCGHLDCSMDQCVKAWVAKQEEETAKNVFTTGLMFCPSSPKKVKKKIEVKPVVKLPSPKISSVVKVYSAPIPIAQPVPVVQK